MKSKWWRWFWTVLRKCSRAFINSTNKNCCFSRCVSYFVFHILLQIKIHYTIGSSN